ncbi:RNA polymerase sigma factor RpoH [Solemya velum gill symbiont]|uniref:RNA polymerase sigma factor RpoH n=1 Tax=Solemya velum gill symbiont TaxID=2340 RepID=A0A1T2HMI1_SOVGS|nr:RNA polymerase sigma factor RpoH [Solemya velum gill symbiont]OOY36162.1 RNA polymerase factor sigma-32 [Solemya velum gill symbiont]OOY38131.1 RNA polymerase factor sigma-32 [Solemya velum gill symbiont]OOY39935.1 RNA polymerase factor sigma-32 [Solemya velum gill symbiont]OOY45157.1 RNA polymerase factor sigma-32 [Solemya velum gill symbiont]OOY48704.1 RNA polymerase factor sigma-32 [Solemya velum gill symbiont]
MSKSNAIALNLPTGSMEAYVSAAFQLPMLSAEEERDYAIKLRDHNDLDAARALVMSHLRFVVRVARGYSGYGLPQQDLIQEGTVGLMKAVKRFNPDNNVRLVSYAVHWIRAEMHEYILRNWRIVKVATTKAQRKLFFNLRSAKKRLGWLNHEEVVGIAEDLGVKPETVLEMEKRLSAHDLPWNAPSDSDDEEAHFSPSSWLPGNTPDPATEIERADTTAAREKALAEALAQLDDRSREILAARWLSEQKMTLQDLAAQYGISAERVRQLEKSAMQKLQQLVDLD